MMKIPYVLVVGEKEEAAGTSRCANVDKDGIPASDEGASEIKDS